MWCPNYTYYIPCNFNIYGRSYKGHFTHETVKVCDYGILRSLIGRKGHHRSSSLHTRRWKPEGTKKLDWMKKSSWIFTWQTMDNDLWYAGISWGLTQFSVDRVSGMGFGREPWALTSTWGTTLGSCVSGHESPWPVICGVGFYNT
jgi:hypothetical protein